jgi:hypothetical protein
MKTTVVLSLLLLLAACNQASKEEALKAEIDSIHREYEAARHELKLKRDSAKAMDMSNDAASLSRLSVAEERMAKLRQARADKKGEFRALKKAEHPSTPSPNTQ